MLLRDGKVEKDASILVLPLMVSQLGSIGYTTAALLCEFLSLSRAFLLLIVCSGYRRRWFAYVGSAYKFLQAFGLSSKTASSPSQVVGMYLTGIIYRKFLQASFFSHLSCSLSNCPFYYSTFASSLQYGISES